MVGTGGAGPSAMSTLPRDAGVPDCAALIRAYPWDRTPLGPIGGWDPAVRATVELILAAPVPMALAYGDEYVLIYNDAYGDVIGARHPGALGRPAAEVFAELWDAPGVGNIIADVYRSGRPYLEAETPLSVNRGSSGRVEQAYFTRGHSVVRDRTGSIAGG